MLNTTPLWTCARYFCVAVAAITLIAPATAQPTCHYTWERIHLPDLYLAGWGINNHGHVAGVVSSAGDTTRAFLWTPEDGVGFLPLPPGIVSMEAYAINDHGQIAGRMVSSTPQWFGFVWQEGVGYTTLTPPSPYGSIYVTDINNSGEVVGSVYRRVIPGPWHWAPFVWESGQFTFLEPLLGEGDAFAEAINELGTIGGNAWGTGANPHAFIIESRSTLFWLPEPVGAQYTRLTDLNNNGIAVGYGAIPNPPGIDAIVWRDGHVSSFTAEPGSGRAALRAVNDAGVAVGFAGVEFNGDYPILWRFDEHRRLSNLLAPPAEAPLGIAVALNERGQVIAGDRVLTPNWLTSDLTGDCHVALEDLAVLLSDFGSSPDSFPSSDINDDGVVDIIDLAFLLLEFGT